MDGKEIFESFLGEEYYTSNSKSEERKGIHHQTNTNIIQDIELSAPPKVMIIENNGKPSQVQGKFPINHSKGNILYGYFRSSKLYKRGKAQYEFPKIYENLPPIYQEIHSQKYQS